MKLDVRNKNGIDCYHISFSSLTDLYNYIKSDPEINPKARNRMESMSSGSSFHGERLSKCIEWCFGGYEKGLENFLVNSSKLKETIVDVSDSRRYVRSLYGGIPIAPLVAADVPASMARYEIDKSLVVRNVYFMLSYNWTTSASQIMNRGLASLFIIQALEEKGQIIDFKTSNIIRSDSWDEIVRIDVELKKPGELYLDVNKSYFPMIGREFLRRILFRVLESVPVTDYEWYDHYGIIMSPEKTREALHLKDDDLLIPEPRALGISGDDIYEDTISTIQALGLEDEFDIEKIKSYQKKRIY